MTERQASSSKTNLPLYMKATLFLSIFETNYLFGTLRYFSEFVCFHPALHYFLIQQFVLN